MVEFSQKFWNYIFTVVVATISQLIILLGPIVILAIAMNFVAQKNETLGYRVFGQKTYLYVFGWLGTSIHELGHAFFAIIFAHKIKEIKLFSPHSGKSLGHVKHSYTKGNPYQTLGNFFIGLGPILLGSVLLFIVTRLLFHLDIFAVAEQNRVILNTSIFTDFNTFQTTLANIGKGVWQCTVQIFSGPQTSWWKLVLFFYLFYAIGSSISLSSSDIKGASRGFFYFVILLFIFNLATLWIGNFVSDFFSQMNIYMSGFYFLITISLCLNVVFILILFLIKLILSLLLK